MSAIYRTVPPRPRLDIPEQSHVHSQFYQHNHVPIVSTNDESFVYNIDQLSVWDPLDHPVENSLCSSQKPSDLTESSPLDIGSEVGLTQILGQTSQSSVFDSNQLFLISPDPISLSCVIESNSISSTSITSKLSTSLDLAAQDPLTVDITAWECDSCDRKFRRKHELSRHRRYHTRPHKCPHQGCEYGSTGFAAPKDVTRHIYSIHRNSSYGNFSQYFCPHPGCSYAERGIGRETGFTRRDNLMRHIQNRHPK